MTDETTNQLVRLLWRSGKAWTLTALDKRMKDSDRSSVRYAALTLVDIQAARRLTDGRIKLLRGNARKLGLI